MTSLSSPLPLVPLGADGPMIGMQGLGCMGISEFYGAADDAQSLATLERAIERGVTLFDTADMYGMGANEEFLSPFIRTHRQDLVIATKYGYKRTPETPDDWGVDNRPEFIRGAVDRSLQRLGVDCIDLYYMHRRDPAVPLEDSVGAMARLVEEGKVRWLGLCAVSADELRVAHAVHPISALQSEWSIFTRDIEDLVIPAAVELGVTIIPYSPLGRGMLTGRSFATTLEADDARRSFPRFAPENSARNVELVARIEAIAAERGVTPAQLSLAWLYAQARQMGVTVVPIPGTRKPARLDENLDAIRVQLGDVVMGSLDLLAATVQGVAV